MLMTPHPFSVKQLLVSCALFCLGLSGIGLYLSPIKLPLNSSYDFMATWLPIVKSLALVTGMAVICLSVIPLVTRRRPMPILILMLLGIVAGLFIGSFIANTLDPNVRYRSATAAQIRMASIIGFSAAAMGALLPLAIIVVVDRYRPPSD